MGRPQKITERVYLVGGPDITDGRDCCVYLVDGGNELALIDAGLGNSGQVILNNIKELGLNPKALKYVVATHGHIDHTGGLSFFKSLGSKVVCHHKELEAITTGNPKLTAAWYYGVVYKPVDVDIILTEEEQEIPVGELALQCPLTPGHTPGGISPYVDTGGKRILFGQDIHGPFDSSWGSNMKDWFASMEKLLALKADILCEGHFGIYSPAEEVARYIQAYINRYS